MSKLKFVPCISAWLVLDMPFKVDQKLQNGTRARQENLISTEVNTHLSDDLEKQSRSWPSKYTPQKWNNIQRSLFTQVNNRH